VLSSVRAIVLPRRLSGPTAPEYLHPLACYDTVNSWYMWSLFQTSLIAAGSHCALQGVHIAHQSFATGQSRRPDANFHARETRQDQEGTEEATVRASRLIGAYAVEIAVYLKARWDLLMMRMDRTVHAA
jgi:hypothetical protein